MSDNDGIIEMRVVDISQQLPGPYASALLVDLGAQVIKVEPPGGDPARRLDPAMYALINAGKSTVTIDLKSPAGVKELHRLVGAADVFIEGFRPGVAARLGASWDVLSALNPALVYCSISACGQEGPYAMVPMHDLNLQAMAGVDPGQGIGVPWVDLGTASSCAVAIVAAWHESGRTGTGRYLDAAMLDTAILWGRVKASAAGRAEPTYGTFPTADGRRVAIAILEDHMWPRLCEALGWIEWRDEPELTHYDARVRRARQIRDRLATACASRPVDEILTLATQYDLPITGFGTAPDTFAHAQLERRCLVQPADRRTPIPWSG